MKNIVDNEEFVLRKKRKKKDKNEIPLSELFTTKKRESYWLFKLFRELH